MTPDNRSAHDYWSAVLRRRSLLVVVPLVVVGAAVFGVHQRPERYASTVTMRVATPGSVSGDAVRADALDYLDRLENTYASLARSASLRTALMRQLHLRDAPEVSVSPHPASELMDVTVRAGTPGTAQRAATALASLLSEKVRDLETEKYGSLESALKVGIHDLEAEIATAQADRDALAGTSNPNAPAKDRLRQLDTDISVKSEALSQRQADYEQVRALLLGGADTLSVAAPANRPRTASGLKLPFVAAVALGLGVVAALGLIALFERLRTWVATREEVEHAADASIIADFRLSDPGAAEVSSEEGETADMLRRLRTELLIMAERSVLRSILVTSPTATGGAEWVATNLAVALARAGQRVVLVDADFSSPALHTPFDKENKSGLAEILLDRSPVETAPEPTSVPTLSVVTAGKREKHGDVRDAVTPARAAKIIAGLEGLYEVVVVKAPPVLAVAESLSFASAVSGVLLAVEVRRTKRSAIGEACQEVREAGASLVGVVTSQRAAGGTR